jgi:prepilin-type N-terminal cleavage/methylation domain-containing protein
MGPLRRAGTPGFTLLELIVVVAVIGVAAAVAVPTYGRMVERSQDRATVVSLGAISNAVAALTGGGRQVDATLLTRVDPETTDAPGERGTGSFRWVDGVAEHAGDVSWALAGDASLSLSMRSPTGRCATAVVAEGRRNLDGDVSPGPCDAGRFDGDAPPGGGDAGVAPDAPAPDPGLSASLWRAGPLAVLADVSLEGWVRISGAPISIQGNLSASGSVELTGAFVSGSTTCSGQPACGVGASSAQQLGEIGPLGQLDATVPTATSMWHAHHGDAAIGTLNYAPGFAPGEWFDLCRDGTARLPNGGGPCAGTVVATPATTGSWVGFEGWAFDHSSRTWVSSQGAGAGALPYGPVPAWLNPNRQRAQAVYFVDGASARLDGSNGGAITVLVAADPADPRTGNLAVDGGGVRYEPVLDGVLFLADGDVRLRSSAPYSGWTGVGERLEAGGSTTYSGTLVVAGAAHRPGSLLGPGAAATLSASVRLNGP